MTRVLRVQTDVGLLSNKRMALEIAVGLCHLSNRRLSTSFGARIGRAPVSATERPAGTPPRDATLIDLFELPIPIVHDDEWAAEHEGANREILDIGTAGAAVCVAGDVIDIDDPVLQDFLNGRTRIVQSPASAAPVVEVHGRLLTHYSYFFHLPPTQRRLFHAVLRAVRPRAPYRSFSTAISRDLGAFNAVHFRRSDLTKGIKSYGAITAEQIAENLSEILPTEDRLLVCSEVEPEDPLFDPLRERFDEVLFANDIILRSHRDGFAELPRSDDNALGLITQMVATRATEFIGTMGSTFTGIIQRDRILANPAERFRFTANFTPEGPVFRDGEFLEIRDGTFSWNRTAMTMPPEVLAWFREWPEVA